MSDHGFIDPDAGMRNRMERLETLVIETLREMPAMTDFLSPEARQIYDDLKSGVEFRKKRAQRRMKELMEDDPL